MKTILGRELPDYIDGYGEVTPFQGAFRDAGIKTRKAVKLTSVNPSDGKVLDNLEQVFDKLNIKDGMTISFHHHLRNGDHVLNMVVAGLANRGNKGPNGCC